ncbi:hypothetical protein FRACYDRAFT_273245 [Fragilariopsis cylindrus CCMP1102]|uniref:YchJ-like middle NTF2-like domain-containing protein n=1 Tax=Fragilariopsis cylindrus CCMP1102 TaxID=635003 RepID=A0A1E7EJH6_9STRA|nr:hypothetical protein FRACYDRAFT_273245 [Fragilariopsis cylindrus CCMP1102]|eukprot:OEU06044.1 hypothetical protein FRACYDRAFT_273245 [Fragilariopsis cylindrus CCMP1102]
MTKLSLSSSRLLIIIVLVLCFIGGGIEAFAAANNNNKKKGGNNNNKNKLKKKKTTGGSNNSGSSSSSFGGFGTPPETYHDVINGFKTRVPSNNEEGDVPCPCNSGNGNGNDDDEHKKIPKTFNECCGPLIASTATSASTAAAASSQAESERTLGCVTPRQVLQSRYVAFYYRDVNHIIQTTNQVCRDYQENKIVWAKELDQNGMFDSFEFVDLTILKEEIIDKQQNDNEEAYLEFTVRLRGRTYEESSSRSIKRSTEQSSLSSIEGDETMVSEKSKFMKDDSTGIWTYAGGDVRSNVKGLDDITLNA